MQQLRPYQTEAIDAIRQQWASDQIDCLLVAATGAGKTQIFLSLLADELDRNPTARALVIAHRQELIDQPIERMRQMRPDWLTAGTLDRPRMGIMMGSHNAADRQLTIATVQTLASEKRRQQLLAAGPIDYLVVDECHHATANTYMSLWRELRAANPAMRHLGVTATPQRADGEGLVKVYQTVAHKITIADLVKQGYLVQPRWLGISTGISIEGVHSRSGDYVASELAQKFDTDSGRAIIVAAYQKYASERRAIAFTASVAGAHDLAAAFMRAGVSARAVDGTTPKDIRASIMADFRAGKFQILTNCQVATEGFDAPGTSCVLMCRPTKSDSLYIQCMGRGLRPALGMAQPNEDCLILDFMPADSRNVIMAGDVLGLPKEITRAVLKDTASDELEPGEVQAGFTFDGEQFNSSGTPMEIIHRELNYLDQSPYTWGRREGMLTLPLGVASDNNERILVIAAGQLLGLKRARGSFDSWQVAPIQCDDPYQTAQELADRHAVKALTSKGAGWHNAPATEPQLKYLKRLARRELKPSALAGLTKREAGELITHFQVRDAIRDWGIDV